MTLLDFFSSVSDLSVSFFGPYVASYGVSFVIHSEKFYKVFLDLGCHLIDVKCSSCGPFLTYKVMMEYSEFEKLLKSLLDN